MVELSEDCVALLSDEELVGLLVPGFCRER